MEQPIRKLGAAFISIGIKLKWGKQENRGNRHFKCLVDTIPAQQNAIWIIHPQLSNYAKNKRERFIRANLAAKREY